MTVQEHRELVKERLDEMINIQRAMFKKIDDIKEQQIRHDERIRVLEVSRRNQIKTFIGVFVATITSAVVGFTSFFIRMFK